MASSNPNLSHLFEDPKYSDLEIISDGRVFSVHRNIVWSRSKVLERECDGKFQEADSRRIEHATLNYIALDRMLQYIYSGDYDLDRATCGRQVHDDKNSKAEEPLAEDPFVSHIYVYAIADYYEIPELQTLAVRRFLFERLDRKHLIKTDQLIHIAEVCYGNTTDQAEELQGELVSLAGARIEEQAELHRGPEKST